MPWKDLNEAIIKDFDSQVTKILNKHEKESKLYLQECENFKGAIDDYIDHKNDLAVLSQNQIFYIISKEKLDLNLPSELHASKIIAKNSTCLLFTSNKTSGGLFLFDTNTKISQALKLENLQSDEEITGGIIQNSTVDKLSLLIATNQGRLFCIKKVFLKIQQNCLANFKGRKIRSTDLIFENFVMILTNQEVLILTSDFVPFQKIPLSNKDSKFIQLLTVSPTNTLLIFETFLFSLELQEGKFSCEPLELPFPIINADLEEDLLVLMMHKNDSNYMLSHYCLKGKSNQYTTEISLEDIDIESVKVSFVILGKKTIVITHNKSIGEDKISQIATLKNHNEGLRERKIDLNSTQKKTLSLKQEIPIDLNDNVLNSESYTLEQKIRCIEKAFDKNPELLFKHTEQILKVLTQKPNNKHQKITKYLIENSSGKINLDKCLDIVLSNKAHIEAIRLFTKMGSFNQAFTICEEQNNIEMMIEILQIIISQDTEEFFTLFKRFIIDAKKNSYQISEDILSEFFTTLPKLVEFLNIIPTSWLKGAKVQETLMYAVNSYSMQQRILSRAKGIQNDEIWGQLNVCYENSPPQKRVETQEDCCNCAKPLIHLSGIAKRPENIIHFFNCKHRFHSSCLEKISLLAIVNGTCPLCK